MGKRAASTLGPTKGSDFIPMEQWGRDHWSTLAYIDAKMVDFGFFVKFDAHMRQNRRNFRVLAEHGLKAVKTYDKRDPGLLPSHVKFAVHNGVAMGAKYASRLRDGKLAEATHDDWCCVQDMATAGLLTCGPDGIQPGVRLYLSPKGARVVDALRAHKRGGGTYATFNPGDLALPD